MSSIVADTESDYHLERVIISRDVHDRQACSPGWNDVLIVMPSTRRPELASCSLESISSIPCSKLVIVSDVDDANLYARALSSGNEAKIISIANMFEHLRSRIRDEDDVKVVHDLCIPRTRRSKTRAWDLAEKRNAALIYGVLHGYRTLILIDDDIGKIGAGILDQAVAASSGLALLGIPVGWFPDLSVVDHARRVLCGCCNNFIAGNCLIVALTKVMGYFAPVYNEDWLFIFAHKRSEVGYLSDRVVSQVEYTPFDPELAAWQEFGDLLAEGIFTAWAGDAIEQIFLERFWKSCLRRRRTCLEEMTKRCLLAPAAPKIQELLPCVRAAQGASAKIDVWMLTEFVHEYRRTCERFCRLHLRLRELPQ